MSAPRKSIDHAENLVGCIGLFISLPIIAAWSAVANGCVIARLWLWFVTPTFHAEPISMGAAAGLAVIVRWVTYEIPKTDDDTPLETLARVPGRLLLVAFLAGMTLLTGWVIKAVWL